MGMRAFKLSRRAVLAASALAAGTLVGCQSTGQQFAQPGVARGDHKSPTSPAFAQVEAGRQLTNSGRMSPQMAIQNQPTMMSPSMVMASNQTGNQGMPVMGSGGMVYPVAYVGSGQTTPQQMMPMQSMTQQMMPMQSMPQQGMMTMHSMPQSAMMPAQQSPGIVMPASAAAGQPLYMIVNGPNGPQYVQVESAPGAGTSMSAAPGTMSVPTAGQTITMSAPEPALAPSPAAPTFIAPPPAFVPTPTVAPAPIEMSSKPPETLPKSVSAKPPTGPVLPASDTTGPSLGAFPAAPSAAPSVGPKLPHSNGATDDFIPSAPVFLPSAR